MDVNILLQLFGKKVIEEEELFDDEDNEIDQNQENQEDDPEDEEDEEEDQEDPEDPEDEEEGQEDHEDDPEDDPEAKPENDKVTKALIAEKRARKKLEKELTKLQQEKREIEVKKKEESQIEALINEGYGESQARRMVQDKTRIEALERKLQQLEFQKLESRYPGIIRYMDEVIELRKDIPSMSIEEIYLAKFKKNSEYDLRTKTEQELLYIAQQAKNKKITKGSNKTDKLVKLTSEESNAYNYLKQNPFFNKLSKKQFKELNDQESLE